MAVELEIVLEPPDGFITLQAYVIGIATPLHVGATEVFNAVTVSGVQPADSESVKLHVGGVITQIVSDTLLVPHGFFT
jgi:hypothetical protein